MDLQETVTINNKILVLIESKHAELPSLWPTSLESRYYGQLLMDTRKAEAAHTHGGLSDAVLDN